MILPAGAFRNWNRLTIFREHFNVYATYSVISLTVLQPVSAICAGAAMQCQRFQFED
jgi:hypothetical protein